MLDWSPDFCLTCDRESISGEAYCSQQCRLADVEKASGASSSSSSPQTTPMTLASAPPSGNGFYLPPPLNFSAMSSSRQTPTARSPVTTSHSAYGYPTQAPQQGRTTSLYSSPSRTSLSSLQSTSPQSSEVYLSDKAKNELRDYASSFDHVRDWKRRMTVV